MVPLQLPPEVLLARMLLPTVTDPMPTLMAPPVAALLPEKVLLVTVTLPALPMAPPSVALLPEKVQLVTVSGKPPKTFEMAPPSPGAPDALLPEKVLVVT